MRITRELPLTSAFAGLALAVMASVLPAQAQTAADAALDLANMLDGAGGGVSGDAYISALENAAEAGQPLALWQLGTMYENGEGVDRDPARAFGYFAQIANQHADTPPRGVEADIVAQSFVKVGDYYRQGVPDAGISPDVEESYRMLQHAASYFGDADAQYRLGLLYLQEDALGVSPLQSARWFSLAARKGHCLAQARLGDMLFNGGEGIQAHQLDGLMWLNIAHIRCAGSGDQGVVDELLARAVSLATPEDRANAAALAQSIAPQFASF
jgi:FOG: TPR repeat, SEL1 subfamily